jgi:hypothetical protein
VRVVTIHESSHQCTFADLAAREFRITIHSRLPSS